MIRKSKGPPKTQPENPVPAVSCCIPPSEQAMARTLKSMKIIAGLLAVVWAPGLTCLDTSSILSWLGGMGL